MISLRRLIGIPCLAVVTAIPARAEIAGDQVSGDDTRSRAANSAQQVDHDLLLRLLANHEARRTPVIAATPASAVSRVKTRDQPAPRQAVRRIAESSSDDARVALTAGRDPLPAGPDADKRRWHEMCRRFIAHEPPGRGDTDHGVSPAFDDGTHASYVRQVEAELRQREAVFNITSKIPGRHPLVGNGSLVRRQSSAATGLASGSGNVDGVEPRRLSFDNGTRPTARVRSDELPAEGRVGEPSHDRDGHKHHGHHHCEHCRKHSRHHGANASRSRSFLRWIPGL